MATLHRFRRDAGLLFEAAVRHVFVDRRSESKTPVPAWARDGLNRWRVEPAQPLPARG